MADIFKKFGLRRIVNVSGTETERGGTPVCAEVVAAVSELVPNSVNMTELQSAANQIIASAFGCESGCISGCTAASIAISVGATMTGSDMGLVEQLPDTSGMRNEVIMQKGHEVTYGQNVSQNVRVTGARVIEIGAATECSVYQLQNAITPQTTAALYVVSHLTVQNKHIDLKIFCDVCHQAGVPVIVDAASQSDPQKYVSAGADLILVSTQKSFGGLTGGIIAGRKDLVQACMYQQHGIGRSMKAGKETVISAIAAIERWMATDWDKQIMQLRGRMERAVENLNNINGIAASILKSQILLEVSEKEAGLRAYQLAQALRLRTPSIIVWDHFAMANELRITLRLVTDEESDYVCNSIAEIMTSKNHQTSDAIPLNPGDRMLAELAQWPPQLNPE